MVRFRAPHPDTDFGLEIGDLKIHIHDLECTWRKGENGLWDVLIFVPGCPALNDPQYAQVAFLMLDALLGEYNVTCRLGYIAVVGKEEKTVDNTNRRPLVELRALMSR